MQFLRAFWDGSEQILALGPFVDETDGYTPETGLTIADTDIKIWKEGATAFVNKNSGGATHMANGVYYATFDSTDADTMGKMVISIKVPGARSVFQEVWVVQASWYVGYIAGGSVIGDIQSGVWDTLRELHNNGGSFGQALQSNGSSTAQDGSASSITLDSSASDQDDYYNTCIVVIVAGTGAGQARQITDYNGTTREATVSPNWETVPDDTSIYIVIGN